MEEVAGSTMELFIVGFLFFAIIILAGPIILFTILFLNITKQKKTYALKLQDIARNNGWTYLDKSGEFITYDNWSEFSFQKTRSFENVLMGVLQRAHSQFVQYIVPRNKQKTLVVTRATIQDTKIEILFTPHNGENVTLRSKTGIFIAANKHEFEGDFSSYFDVYYSDDEQIDLYTLFTPDVLLYIKQHLSRCTIAVNGAYLFIYSDDMSPESRAHMVALADGLVSELRLGISTIKNSTNASTSRTAIDNQYEGVKQLKKGLGKRFWLAVSSSVGLTILYVIMSSWLW